MLDYHMTKEDANIELWTILDAPDLNGNYEKQGSLGACYYALGKFDLAAVHYRNSYNLHPTNYVASLLIRLYKMLEMVDALEEVCFRFQEDNICLGDRYIEQVIKVFEKNNRIETIKTFARNNWGSITYYLKRFYGAKDYEFCLELIGDNYTFESHTYVRGTDAEIFLYSLLCKTHLEQYEEIKSFLDNMKRSAKVGLINYIGRAAYIAKNADVFISVLEDLYLGTKCNVDEAKYFLLKLYDKFGYNDKKKSFIKTSFEYQKKALEKVFSKLLFDTRKLDATDEDVEELKRLYADLDQKIDSIADKYIGS